MVEFDRLRPKNGKQKSKKKIYAVLIGIVPIVLLLLAGGYFLLFLPAQKVYLSSQVTIQHLKAAKQAFDTQNFEMLSEEIRASQDSLDQTKRDYQYFQFLHSIPWIKTYFQDGEHLLNAGNHGLIGAQILAEGIKPFSDILGFEKTQAEEMMTAEEKLAYIVGIMPQIVTSVNGAQQELKIVKDELSIISPDRYPDKMFGYELKSNIQSAKDLVDRVDKIVNDLLPFLDILPKALGQPDPKNYLILFQNDKELRPTGGFITAYALTTFEKGRFKVTKSEDIYNIDHDQSYLSVPEPIKQYLVPVFYMRDTNFSPDFKKSMDDFAVYYEKSNLPGIDGIIALDTEFVRSFLEVLGPMYLAKYDETFEASNVVYELELYAEKILSGTTRKDLLGELMMTMIEKVFETKKEQWKSLINQGIREAQEKHVLFYMKDLQMQSLVEKFNFAGRIVEFEGDYLHISDANLGGLKSDMYVERKADLKTSVSEDGTITNELTITYTNTGSYDGWLNAPTRDYVRIYVPQGSKLISSEGGLRTVGVFEDLGKTVFDNFTQTYPVGLGKPNSQVIKFVYEVPFKLKKSGLLAQKEYKLLIQKQAGLIGPEYNIDFNGEIRNLKLETDQELSFKITP